MSSDIGFRIGELGIAVLGAVFSTPTGGWSAVAATAAIFAIEAGRMLTAGDVVQEEQKIANVPLQDSTFGKVIPQIWGTMGNMAGNVIWAGGKQVHDHRESTSGKGGGPKQVSIKHTYTMSMALGLCDTRLTGPMTGLRKISRDLQVVFDINDAGPGAIATFEISDGGTGYGVGDSGFVGGGNTDAIFSVDAVGGGGEISQITMTNHGTGYAIILNAHLHRNTGVGNNAKINIFTVIGGNNLPSNYTFYPGSATQNPDPTIQAEEPDLVPAYRYLSYVVLTAEELGRSGRTMNYTFEIYQEDGVTLTVLVPSLCLAAGLEADEIDITAIPASPDFYDAVSMKLDNIVEVKFPIEQLSQAYRFYSVESGTKLVFRALGSGGIIAAIPEALTSAAEEKEETMGLDITRNDVNNMPKELNVTYMDPARDYLNNTQRAILEIPVGDREAPRAVQVGILALPASHARRLAQEFLNEIWIQRETATTKLPPTYAYLEPGDRVTIVSRGITYTEVITATSYGRPGIFELEMRQDAGFVVNAPVPDPGIVPIDFIEIIYISDTTGYLMNLPALTNTDIPPRYLVGYVGQPTGWPGAALFRSLDAEATYQQVDAGDVQLITGVVEIATPATDFHVLDTTTTITVVMESGTLDSVSDLGLFNGANLCAIGTEILGFGVATLVATKTYELTRLLRGRRGTEHLVGTHDVFERFVLLDIAVRPVSMSMADRYVERPYKTVTNGQSIADVVSVPFTPTANNLNPWSIANIGATLDGTDWVLTWYMRSRFSGDWQNNQGIGFDLDFVGFQVNIYSDVTYVTLKRSTLTDGGSPLDPEAVMTWTYTTAMQTTDFGSAQSTVYYRIFQVTNNGISVADDLVAA